MIINPKHLRPHYLFFLLLLIATKSSAVFADQIDDEIKRAGLKHKMPPSGGITSDTPDEGFYQVKKINNRLVINQLDWKNNGDLNTHELDFNGIKLAGTNRGEWGGELTLQAPGKDPVVILKDNIVTLLTFKDSIYIATGLAHMGYNNGAVYKLEYADAVPKLNKITLLPAEPEFALTDEENIYILTDNGLVTLKDWGNHFSLNIIVHNAIWDGFVPKSMVKIDKSFVIGMYSGVVVLRNKGNEQYEQVFYGK